MEKNSDQTKVSNETSRFLNDKSGKGTHTEIQISTFPGSSQIGQTGLRVHPHGGWGEWTGKIDPRQFPLPE